VAETYKAKRFYLFNYEISYTQWISMLISVENTSYQEENVRLKGFNQNFDSEDGVK
jgi:hypothetical protein